MMNMNDENLAADVASGAYFNNAQRWYSEIFHTPIAQRSYYLLVILLSVVNVYFAVQSFLGVFPIVVPVPFITFSNNIWEDIPRIHRLSTQASEDKNVAVMKFFLSNYVENRESYDLPLFELRFRNIWSESTPTVFNEYKQEIDAANPYSFYKQFTNRSRRQIEINSLTYEQNGGTSIAHVVFTAHVLSMSDGQETATSKWRADFSYKYTDFYVDQSLETRNPIAIFFGLTGKALKVSGDKRKVVPMTFIVSDYKVKELLE